MKKKKLLRILIFIIIIILLICIFKLKNYIEKSKVVDGVYTQKDLDIIDDEVKNYTSDKIIPRGMSKLYGNYKGDNDLNDIYRSIYIFVNYLPTLSKKVKFNDNDSIVSYYEKNKNKIENNIGITNSDDFIKFIGYLNKVGYNQEKFIDCQIDSSTFKTEKSYFSFNLIFNFENFENEVKLKLNFANYATTQPTVYYSIIEDENIE